MDGTRAFVLTHRCSGCKQELLGAAPSLMGKAVGHRLAALISIEMRLHGNPHKKLLVRALARHCSTRLDSITDLFLSELLLTGTPQDCLATIRRDPDLPSGLLDGFGSRICGISDDQAMDEAASFYWSCSSQAPTVRYPNLVLRRRRAHLRLFHARQAWPTPHLLHGRLCAGLLRHLLLHHRGLPTVCTAEQTLDRNVPQWACCAAERHASLALDVSRGALLEFKFSVLFAEP